MNSLIKAYLDDFFLITLIIPKNEYQDNSKYTLLYNDEIIDLKIKNISNEGDYTKVIAVFDVQIELNKKIYVLINNKKVEIYMGKISRSNSFDSIYSYTKNDLGINYKKSKTTFKIWAPTVSELYLELTNKENISAIYKMASKDRSTYEITINQDLEGYKYRYKIKQNGKFSFIYDEYAISASDNSEYSYIIDKNKTYKNKYKTSVTNLDNLNYSIYELSIRDFTSYFKDDGNRSTYGYLVKPKLKNKYDMESAFDYLKTLNIDYIELMPTFLFGAVDEKDRFFDYNWGYNPIAYNVPSGVYSINSNDPYSRINELKEMIDIIHKNKMKVIMDVVFNHVYDRDNYPLEVINPGYMFNYDENGIKTEISGCKNDVNTKRFMVRKYIINSLKYYLEFYNVDGFRFDLMGLIDVDTMNIIIKELKLIKKDVLIFGEGWKMIDSIDYAHMYNKKIDNGIGFFNDQFRESIRNYIIGNVNEEMIYNSIIGSPNLFNNPHESINYIECHDGLTLYDFIKDKNIDKNNIMDKSILGICMNILSFGIPFIHSGMEFGYSKGGVRDSYNKGDDVNKINWDLLKDNNKYVNCFKELIKIRKNYKVFSLDDYEEIEKKVKFIMNKTGTILLYVDNLLIIYKNNNVKESIDFKNYSILSKSININDNIIDEIGYIVLRME